MAPEKRGLKGGRSQTDYVQKVREDSRRVSQGLLSENERLRARVAGLEAENERLSGDLAATTERYSALEERLKRVEQESHRFSQDYLHVEQQNQNLANLYVASYRLHETLDREEILLALQEIVMNLVGSEEMGVFELSGDGRTLVLAGAFGLDKARYREIPAERGCIGEALRTGQTYVAGPESPARGEGEESLTACIPLLVEGRPTGVIAIFSLLSHKSGIEDVDRELFELLAVQASVALYSSQLHSQSRDAASRG